MSQHRSKEKSWCMPPPPYVNQDASVSLGNDERSMEVPSAPSDPSDESQSIPSRPSSSFTPSTPSTPSTPVSVSINIPSPTAPPAVYLQGPVTDTFIPVQRSSQYFTNEKDIQDDASETSDTSKPPLYSAVDGYHKELPAISVTVQAQGQTAKHKPTKISAMSMLFYFTLIDLPLSLIIYCWVIFASLLCLVFMIWPPFAKKVATNSLRRLSYLSRIDVMMARTYIALKDEGEATPRNSSRTPLYYLFFGSPFVASLRLFVALVVLILGSLWLTLTSNAGAFPTILEGLADTKRSLMERHLLVKTDSSRSDSTNLV